MKTLGLEYLRLFYRTFRFILLSLQTVVSPSAACHLQNLFLLICGSKLRFNYDKKTGLFLAIQDDEILHFGEMSRGFEFYGGNIFKRGDELFSSYCLNHIQFDKEDLVIDCGANYADLWICLKKRIKEENYITFEPGPIEYKCITKNAPKANNFNLGLSDREGVMDFFLCSESGDSSIVEPKQYTKIVNVNVTTLDAICKKEAITNCKLLKLEAEGWEPEILDGAKEFLKCCEYIAIDGGKERGVQSEATFHTLNNTLMNAGFLMVDINGPTYRALYHNSSVSTSSDHVAL